MAGTRDISCNSIQQFDLAHFHVASISQPGTYYEIDLNRLICNCPNFPRSRFCKHLTAIHVHFPLLCTERKPPIDPEFWGEPERVLTPEVHQTSSPQGSLQKLGQEIKLLSKQLDDKIVGLTNELAPAVMAAARSVRYSLTAVIASTQGMHALPDKEPVLPNQHSWPEMAEQMGVKHTPKCRLPSECGLTERSIGAWKGKRKMYADPYAGGERSGKCTKPDALSATVNARAGPPPPPMPSPPNVLPSPNVPPFAHAPAFPHNPIPGTSAFFSNAFPSSPGPSTPCAPPLPGFSMRPHLEHVTSLGAASIALLRTFQTIT